MTPPTRLGRLLAAVRHAPERARRTVRGERRPDRVDYPGDFTGVVRPEYSPDLDGDADPGEIVWTWVPYEEDARRGKDRPVLVVGRDGRWLLGLMLSTRDHDAQPGRNGETWVDLGIGEWDSRRRSSEIRVDRIIRIDALAVRREGAILDRQRFDLVADSLATARGW